MNPGNDGRQEDMVKDLMTQVKCHACGKPFQTENISVIGHEENMWFLKVSCRSCGKSNLTVAMVNEIERPKLHSDLSRTERRKFRYYEIPTTDDLLDMHCFLKEFDGDFAHLFREDTSTDR